MSVYNPLPPDVPPLPGVTGMSNPNGLGHDPEIRHNDHRPTWKTSGLSRPNTDKIPLGCYRENQENKTLRTFPAKIYSNHVLSPLSIIVRCFDGTLSLDRFIKGPLHGMKKEKFNFK